MNLWKLKKTVYGLCDAPRSWYLKVSDGLVELGMEKSIYDEAVFYWRNNGSLEGIICCHVDDFYCSGTDNFEKHVLKRLKTKFNIGSEDLSNFRYIGLNISSTNEYIEMHQNDYIESIELIEVDGTRLSNTEDLLFDDEAQQLKSLAGQLNWVATQTRPDMAFASCDLSASSKNATVKDIIRANKYVKKLKDQKVNIRYPNLGDIRSAKIIAYSDAAFANLQGKSSQAHT